MSKGIINRYYLLVFSILYFSTSWYAKNILSESANLFLVGIILVFTIIGNRKRYFVVHLKAIQIILSLMMISLCACVIKIDVPKNTIYEILIYAIAIIVVGIVSIRDYCEAFVNCICLTSFFSVITWFIGAYAPKILAIFPLVRNDPTVKVYNLFFCVERIDEGMHRLHGFCWEPGAFQTLLNIAIGLLIFVPQISNYRRKLIILFVALLLTFSTTGYIAGIINLILFLTKAQRKECRIFGRIIFIGLGLVGALIVLYPIVPVSIKGVSFGFYKIKEFLQGTTEARGTYDSASVRFDSIYYAIKSFINNPLVGKGFRGMDNDGRMYTCTPLNYFAYKGAVYGVIVMCGWAGLCKYVCQFKIHQILLWGMVMVAIISENYLNYLFASVFIVYGIVALCINKESRFLYEWKENAIIRD